MEATFAFVQPDDALFARLWDEQLAASNPECSLYYLDALVSSEPDKQHIYLLGLNAAGNPIAVAYFSVQSVAFILGTKIKVLTLGGSLSADAFWINTTLATYAQAMQAMLKFCSKNLRYHVVLLKPFAAIEQALALSNNKGELGFINVYASTQAEVDLAGIKSYDDYTATLEKKKRYYLRKVQKDAEQTGLTIEVTSDFAQVVPEIYPLYLSVIARATEVKDNDPLPPKYFEKLSGLSMLNSKAVLVRKADRLVGFLILLEKDQVFWCGPCGMDHATVKQFNTWYLLILQAIKCAIEARSKRAILGTTNFPMKKKFGARRTELWISLRLRSLLLTRTLTPFIRLWLKKNVFSAEGAEQLVEEPARGN